MSAVYYFMAGVLGFAASPEMVPIFNGTNWNGWDLRGQANYQIVDGAIVGTTGKGGHGWLCTSRAYGDFILEAEVRIQTGNAGIQIRSRINDKDVMVGYQIEVDPTPRAWSGGLYEQGRRAWLQNLTNNPAARAAFKTGEWNHYRIEARGDWIRSWVNGVPATDYRDAMDLNGVIALQVHSGKNVKVEYRNIRLADLGQASWKPLWDGSSLKGWRPTGKGQWSIVDGAIRGVNAASEKEYGHLVSSESFKDFVVRLKYKAVAGNSGLYFRIAEKGFSGVTGFQAEIDPMNDVGGLYETNGRSWVSRPRPAEVKKWHRPDQWNTMTVHAQGGRIKVDVNGFQTAELMNEPGRTGGPFALQVHGGQDVEVWFKDIEILDGAK